jgi:hypothetical protein
LIDTMPQPLEGRVARRAAPSVHLTSPEWDPEHLKRLFDFADAESIRVLVNAGYEQRDDGFWQRSSSATAEGHREAMAEIDRQAWRDLNP